MAERYEAVLFDFDGVLVDSELLSTRALLAEAEKFGCSMLPADAARLFRGHKLSVCIKALEDRFSVRLPEHLEADVRHSEAIAFGTGLGPIDGIAEALRKIDLPRCVASSAPHPKIVRSLQITGLLDHFGSNIFSSYDIGSWKPSPGIFLHAASKMGFSPSQCIVIEDSLPGVQAAAAAGMRVMAYVGHLSRDARELEAAGATVFAQMHKLPALLASV